MDSERTRVVEEIGRDDAAEVVRLRTQGIPQRVGMVAAARVLAQDVTQTALARIEAQRVDGTLASRLEEVPDCPAPDALAGILREEVAFLAARIRELGEQWLNDSLRLEGQADALQGRLARLVQSNEQEPEPQMEAQG